MQKPAADILKSVFNNIYFIIKHLNMNEKSAEFSFKTGISNAMDGTEDDMLWTTKEDSDHSDTDENDDGVTDYSGWDHDEKISEEEWIGLFILSDEDPSDFEGF